MSRIKLFVREFGAPDAPPLIILHGLFGMSDNWVTIAKILSKNHFVIVPDLRNHGNSPHTDEFSYDLMIEDIIGLMDDRNLVKSSFMGHSMGGKLAMNFAVNFPEKIEKLIVADMSLKLGELKDIHAVILNTISRTDLTKFNTFAEIELWFDAFISQKKIVLFALKNIRKKEDGSFEWKLNYFSLYQNTHRVMEAVVPFKAYEKSALFIRGGLSDYVLDEDIDEIKSWFPKAEIATIPGASHWVHADNPKMFLELVTGFLV